MLFRRRIVCRALLAQARLKVTNVSLNSIPFSCTHILTFYAPDFGYLDGVSQPAIAGFNTQIAPGQSLILPGIILLGEPGDQSSRPSWARDGSFLVFRQLKQLVPEWNKFLADNPIKDPAGSLTPQQGSELLGARIVGRWKSVRWLCIPLLWSLLTCKTSFLSSVGNANRSLPTDG
jgi:hypothetical protein